MRTKKFFKAMAGIFKVLLVMVLIFMAVYLALTIWNTPVDNKFVLYIGSYGKNPEWLQDYHSNDIDELFDQIGAEGELNIGYKMYAKACEKLMLTKAYGVRAVSSIDVTAIGLSLQVASNRTEQYKIAGTPEYNANQKTYSSYTNTIYVLEASDGAIGTILKSTIQFADRGYSDGNNSYKQKGSLRMMDDGGENIKWSSDYAPETATAARTYKDGELREKCNFIINTDTILPDSVSITREFDKKEGMYKYRVKMSLDCSDNSEGSATYYEAKAIGDVLGSNMKSLTYSKMDIDMTLYSNGYLITWDTEQEWTLNYDIKLSVLTGTALNKKSEVFSYDPRDCEVVDFTK